MVSFICIVLLFQCTHACSRPYKSKKFGHEHDRALCLEHHFKHGPSIVVLLTHKLRILKTLITLEEKLREEKNMVDMGQPKPISYTQTYPYDLLDLFSAFYFGTNLG